MLRNTTSSNTPGDGHPWNQITETPRHSPSTRLAALYEFRNSIISNASAAQLLDDDADAGEFAQHTAIPLHSLAQNQRFGDHTAYEGDFAAGCHHFCGRAGAGAVWWPGLLRRGGEELGGRGVEGRVAHCKGDSFEAKCGEWDERVVWGGFLESDPGGEVIIADIAVGVGETEVIDIWDTVSTV